MNVISFSYEIITTKTCFEKAMGTCNLEMVYFIDVTIIISGRRGGLIGSALESGLKGPGSSPGWIGEFVRKT